MFSSKRQKNLLNQNKQKSRANAEIVRVVCRFNMHGDDGDRDSRYSAMLIGFDAAGIKKAKHSVIFVLIYFLVLVLVLVL